MLKADQPGLENSVNVSVSDTGDSNNTDASGLSRLAFNTSVTNLDQTKAGANATLSINGLSVSSASNSVSDAVDGVTFNLKEVTTSPVTITVARDTAKAKAALEDFVDQFNELTQTLNSLTSYNAAASQDSVLTGDATLRTLTSSLRDYLNKSISTGSNYTTLAELGVTTNVLDGTLQIDSTTLQQVLDTDPAEIGRVLAAFGSTTDSNVQFVNATANTTEGSYAVVGTESASTAGSWLAGGSLGNPSFNGGNNARFSLTIDGLGTQTITVSNNFDTNVNDNASDTTEEALIAADIQASITSAFGSAVATVAFESGILKITSASTGSSSSVTLSPDSGASYTEGNSRLGISTGQSTAGTSTYSYTLNGLSTTESSGILTGAVGSQVEGLQFKVTGNASGSLGTVNFTRGIATQINDLVSDLLSTGGLIEARLDGLNSSVEDLSDQRDALEIRAAALERRYRTQFNGLETLISQLNTTQTYLSQALTGFVEPNTTLRK